MGKKRAAMNGKHVEKAAQNSSRLLKWYFQAVVDTIFYIFFYMNKICLLMVGARLLQTPEILLKDHEDYRLYLKKSLISS